MLEFYGMHDESPLSMSLNKSSEIFTFALPPEAEDFDYSQRVNETKTFGGAIIDDYGNDTFKIVLSGSTVNNERKLIYKGTKALPGYLTGEQEILKLRDLIYKGGELENLEDKKVYLYDLSKMNLLQIAASSPTTGSWWRVHIKSLKIKRSKDKPFTYSYTLDMIGYREDYDTRKSLFNSGFMDAVNAAQGVLDSINTVTATVDMAVALCGSMRRGLTECKELYEKFSNGNLSTGDKVKLAFGLGGSVERSIIGTSTLNSLYSDTMSLVNDCKTLSEWEDIGTSDIVKSGSISDDEKFTVTFDANGGHFTIDDEETETYKETVSYSENAVKPTNPTRGNYEFSYWYQFSSPDSEFGFSETPIKGDITLYAKWVQKKAIVSFNSRGGSAIEPQTVDIGGNATKPSENPTREGYAFRQWCSNFAATTPFDFTTAINADTTIYAAWDRITAVTVSFDSNGGSDVDSQSVEPGNKITYPVTPTKADYVFAGWYTDSDLTLAFDFSQEITRSMTLYAKWTHCYCNVTFDGKGGSETAAQKIIIGGTAEIPEIPTREGYTFVFWCGDSAATNEFDFSSPILSDITLYARWVLNKYDVEFESNGGSPVASQSVNHGSLAVFPEIPTKDDYSFYKWCSDKYLNDEFDFSAPVTSEMTLYARWFGSAYTFSFESNGGSEVAAQSIEHGKTAQMKKPSKEGFSFVGWFADEELTEKFDFSTAIEHDTTVYAKWEEEEKKENDA